jgi:hypothetical protein
VVKWNQAGNDLKPFKIIIETLISLYEDHEKVQCRLNQAKLKRLVSLVLYSQDPNI